MLRSDSRRSGSYHGRSTDVDLLESRLKAKVQTQNKKTETPDITEIHRYMVFLAATVSYNNAKRTIFVKSNEKGESTQRSH